MAEPLKPFAGHEDILRVIKDGRKNALTADHIREIIGGTAVSA
jgi:hypothetical protein